MDLNNLRLRKLNHCDRTNIINYISDTSIVCARKLAREETFNILSRAGMGKFDIVIVIAKLIDCSRGQAQYSARNVDILFTEQFYLCAGQ